MSSIPGLGRFPGGGNRNPLQYSCLGNPMDRGAWQATVCGAAELDTTEVTERALSLTALKSQDVNRRKGEVRTSLVVPR